MELTTELTTKQNIQFISILIFESYTKSFIISGNSPKLNYKKEIIF